MSLIVNILIILLMIQLFLGIFQVKSINNKIKYIKSHYSKEYKINISVEKKFKIFKLIIISVWHEDDLISIYTIQSYLFKLKVKQDGDVKNKKIQNNINVYLRGEMPWT